MYFQGDVKEVYSVQNAERPETGGPCWLLKLRWWLKEYKWKGPSLVASLGSGHVVPIQDIFFLTLYYFTSFAPIAQQAGPAVVPGHLCVSDSMYGENDIFILIANISQPKECPASPYLYSLHS